MLIWPDISYPFLIIEYATKPTYAAQAMTSATRRMSAGRPVDVLAVLVLSRQPVASAPCATPDVPGADPASVTSPPTVPLTVTSSDAGVLLFSAGSGVGCI